ncbi:unnamed protein product [Cyberlindnera jadinii]|uniref:Uncharacterized protein n=1 Tax=Cyberlindnera jadinii (strain ATCC 18201 / CBS 1600 / BCRC 20928 / JCM 3617 / NBRC 0987 / NRRL Y-1542) TaxID=983966 RepID=A0A0H5C466_CYBJN|nr:unnamed protein product [Cyberlindnera jadinii]
MCEKSHAVKHVERQYKTMSLPISFFGSRLDGCAEITIQSGVKYHLTVEPQASRRTTTHMRV